MTARGQGTLNCWGVMSTGRVTSGGMTRHSWTKRTCLVMPGRPTTHRQNHPRSVSAGGSIRRIRQRDRLPLPRGLSLAPAQKSGHGRRSSLRPVGDRRYSKPLRRSYSVRTTLLSETGPKDERRPEMWRQGRARRWNRPRDGGINRGRPFLGDSHFIEGIHIDETSRLAGTVCPTGPPRYGHLWGSRHPSGTGRGASLFSTQQNRPSVLGSVGGSGSSVPANPRTMRPVTIRDEAQRLLATPRGDTRFGGPYLRAALASAAGCQPTQAVEALWGLVSDGLAYVDPGGEPSATENWHWRLSETGRRTVGGEPGNRVTHPAICAGCVGTSRTSIR